MQLQAGLPPGGRQRWVIPL